MQKAGLIGLALLALIGAGVLWRSHERARAGWPDQVAAATVAVAPAPVPPPTPAPAAPPPASAVSARPRPAPSSAPPAGLPALSYREIAALPVHTVPEDPPPPLPRPLRLDAAPPPAAPRTAEAPAPSAAPPPRQLAGRAEAVGPATLAIAGERVALYGVRPPAAGDRCTGEAGTTRPCTEQAERALAAHLGRTVICRFPRRAAGAPRAICLDGTGVDLGGLLVAEGLALADRTRSADYVGAESVAQSLKRGLWLTR